MISPLQVSESMAAWIVGASPVPSGFTIQTRAAAVDKGRIKRRRPARKERRWDMRIPLLIHGADEVLFEVMIRQFH
jgi:hypothetical protein